MCPDHPHNTTSPQLSCGVQSTDGHIQPCQVLLKLIKGFQLHERSKSAFFLHLTLWLYCATTQHAISVKLLTYLLVNRVTKIKFYGVVVCLGCPSSLTPCMLMLRISKNNKMTLICHLYSLETNYKSQGKPKLWGVAYSTLNFLGGDAWTPTTITVAVALPVSENQQCCSYFRPCRVRIC